METIMSSLKFNYAKGTEADFLRHTADMEQIAWARASELSEGDGRGNRIIDINNGSGLAFTVAPDRGLDIVEASFCGIPLAFRAPAGHVNPGRALHNGLSWLRSWSGGLLTSCGLRHVGPPEDDENPLDPHRGLHGRISAQSSSDTFIHRGWENGHYAIKVGGTLREAMMFGENLRIGREITTALGDNSIHIEDTVRNIGSNHEFIQMLYHCNFGYPFIAQDSRLEAPPHKITPRDESTVPGLGSWHIMSKPESGVKEQCFLHELPSDEYGWASISLSSPFTGVKLMLSYDSSTLPRLMQWKLMENGRYVLGLEPTNTTVSGRAKDISNGIAPRLEAGESIRFRVRLSFELI